MRFTAAVSHEVPSYVARCLEVEVTSQGETVNEALSNLREALQLYFEDQPFPEGIEPPIIATVNVVDTGVENAAVDRRTSPQCLCRPL